MNFLSFRFFFFHYSSSFVTVSLNSVTATHIHIRLFCSNNRLSVCSLYIPTGSSIQIYFNPPNICLFSVMRRYSEKKTNCKLAYIITSVNEKVFVLFEAMLSHVLGFQQIFSVVVRGLFLISIVKNQKYLDQTYSFLNFNHQKKNV